MTTPHTTSDHVWDINGVCQVHGGHCLVAATVAPPRPDPMTVMTTVFIRTDTTLRHRVHEPDDGRAPFIALIADDYDGSHNVLSLHIGDPEVLTRLIEVAQQARHDLTKAQEAAT